jgi:hypothetical protein
VCPITQERSRSRRAIDEQRRLIRRYPTEYVPLCERSGLAMPADIALVSSSFSQDQASSNPVQARQNENFLSSHNLTRDDSQNSMPRRTSKGAGRVQSSMSSLQEVAKGILDKYLCGQFFLLLVFLIGVLDNVVGIFEVPACPRRLTLTTLTFLGGVTILSLSFLGSHRNRFHTWDRWRTLGFLVAVALVLGELAYQQCVLVNTTP